jgi:Zn-finger nucleic acid-binding protein
MRLDNGGNNLRCEFCSTMLPVATDEGGIQFVDEAYELECSKCAVSLWAAVLAGAQLHACKECHGMLSKMRSLQPLIDAMRTRHPGGEIPAPADPAERNRNVNCPRCRKHMLSDFYAGGGNAVISSCEQCELNWLEDGVLMRIVRAQNAIERQRAW